MTVGDSSVGPSKLPPSSLDRHSPGASSAAPAAPLKGLRILLVEDTALVASEFKRVLAREGCELVAHCDSLSAALDAARSQNPLSGALLDVNLRGELVYPAAEILAERGVPLIFLTGYSGEFLPVRFAACPILEKPFSAADLRKAMLSAFVGLSPSSPPIPCSQPAPRPSQL
jgi:CheY-like chemotaxis protein